MSQSTPTIFSVVSHAASCYKTARGHEATKAFITRYIKMRLTNEMAQNHGVGNDKMHNFRIINTIHGALEIVIVDEARRDFILIGNEDDYLSYVVERTVL